MGMLQLLLRKISFTAEENVKRFKELLFKRLNACSTVP